MIKNLIDTLPLHIKPLIKMTSFAEAKRLPVDNFAIDCAQNTLVGGVLGRSIVEKTEKIAFETAENTLVYFFPTPVRKFFSKIYGGKLSNDVKKGLDIPLKDIDTTKFAPEELKQLKATKAAVALGGMFVPLTEFTLSYFKVLGTLKGFKKADFNNIANLENKTEDTERQKKVRDHSVKKIIQAGAAYAGIVGTSVLMAKRGKNNELLQHISEAILTPGTKFFKNTKFEKFANKRLSLDLHNPIVPCVVIGGLAYFDAAKQRGKLEFLETMTRFPITTFFAITGSSLFRQGYMKSLQNKDGYKEIIRQGKDGLELDTIASIAAKAPQQKEFNNLCGKYAKVVALPMAFSIAVGGFAITSISMLFTKLRYERDTKNKQQLPMPVAFRGFTNPLTYRTQQSCPKMQQAV
jgi:hypothetical protein